MTRVVSFTLVNVYEITWKNGITIIAITVLKSASHGCFQSFAGLREHKIVVPDEKKVGYAETYLLMTFSQITVTQFEQLKKGFPTLPR